MWQKCPICNGSGYQEVGFVSTTPKCPVCKGHRIISEINGLPPARDIELDHKPYVYTPTEKNKYNFNSIDTMLNRMGLLNNNNK